MSEVTSLAQIEVKVPEEQSSPTEKPQIDYLNRSVWLRICSALGNRAAQRLDRIKATIGEPIREVLDIMQSSSNVSDEWEEFITLDELKRKVYEYCLKDPQNTAQLRQVADRDPVNAVMNIYNYMHGIPVVIQPKIREQKRGKRGFEIPRPLPTIKSEQSRVQAKMTAQHVKAKEAAEHDAYIQRRADEIRRALAMQEQQRKTEYESIMATVDCSEVDATIEKDIRYLEAECEQLCKLDSQNEETQTRLSEFLAKITTTRINNLLMLLQLHPRLAENVHRVNQNLRARYDNKLAAVLKEKFNIKGGVQESYQSEGKESSDIFTCDQGSEIKVIFSSLSERADIYIEVQESLDDSQQPNKFSYDITANNGDNVECAINHDDSTKRFRVTSIYVKNLTTADVPSLGIKVEANPQ